MSLLKEYIKDLISSSEKILIPPPPPIEDRIAELPKIQQQKNNPKNPGWAQEFLDKKVSKLFNNIIKEAGYESYKDEVKQIKNSIKPIIKWSS